MKGGGPSYFWINVLVALLIQFTLQGGATLTRVNLEGPKLLREETLKKEVISRYIGHPASSDNLEFLINDLLNFYEDHGLPLARIDPTSLQVLGDSLELSLYVDEGPLVVVNDLDFRGNKITRDRVLRRFFNVVGRPFNGSDFKRGISLMREQGIAEIDSFGFRKAQEGYYVVAYIGREATNSVQGIFSVTNRSHPTGEINLRGDNLWGTARRLNLLWKRISLKEQEARITYREPWLLGLNLYGEVKGTYLFRELLYSKKEVSFLLGRNLGIWKLAVGAKKFSNEDLVERKSERGNRGLLSLDFRVTYGKTLLSISNFAEFDQNGAKVSFSSQSQSKLQSFSVLILMKIDKISGFEPRRYDLFSVGGPATLRGYPEGHFLSRENYILRVEASSLLGSGLFLFVEGGEIRTLSGVERPLDYGIGIRGSSLLGELEVSLAFVRGMPLGDGIITMNFQRPL